MTQLLHWLDKAKPNMISVLTISLLSGFAITSGRLPFVILGVATFLFQWVPLITGSMFLIEERTPRKDTNLPTRNPGDRDTISFVPADGRKNYSTVIVNPAQRIKSVNRRNDKPVGGEHILSDSDIIDSGISPENPNPGWDDGHRIVSLEAHKQFLDQMQRARKNASSHLSMSTDSVDRDKAMTTLATFVELAESRNKNLIRRYQRLSLDQKEERQENGAVIAWYKDAILGAYTILFYASGKMNKYSQDMRRTFRTHKQHRAAKIVRKVHSYDPNPPTQSQNRRSEQK